MKQAGPEPYYCFIPAPLPPKPPLKYDEKLQALTERAGLALGRLDAVTAQLPNPELLLYAYIRKEAVLSSQIEGTQSSLSDLLLYENNEAPGVPEDDVREVSNYVSALEYGLRRLKTLPVSLR
ncbi:MAG: Fic/DOC family N-terminal domain-containing protein, partial [Elusimicrobiota bacterium]